jgi:hypothetical protein
MKTKNLKLFEKYYNGQMSHEEKVDFDTLLSSDPELSAEFKEYLSIYDAISDQDTLDLRIKLREIREENSKDRSTLDFFSFGYNWLWVAAILAIIVSFTTIISLLISDLEMDKQIIAESMVVTSAPVSQLDRELSRFEQRHSDFKLVSPLDPIIYRNVTPLEFRWTISAVDKLMIELIDKNGTIVYSSGRPVASPYKVRSKLPSGILLFRFRTENEAYHLGFLLIK